MIETLEEELIEQEGFVEGGLPYMDIGGTTTIGFGYTKYSLDGKDGRPHWSEYWTEDGTPTGKTMSKEEATDLLPKIKKIYTDQADSSLTNKNLSQQQRDALANLIYRNGIGNVKNSGVIDALNSGEIEKAQQIIKQDPNLRKSGGKVLKEGDVGYKGITNRNISIADSLATTEVTGEETVMTSDPLKKVFDYVSNKKYYTNGDFEKFKQDFSTPEKQDLLYKVLKKDKSFTQSKGDFLNGYFPITEEEESEIITEDKGDSSNTLDIDWNSPELKGKWNYVSDDIGQSIWSREYEVKNKDGSTEIVSEIVPTNNVPKEILEQWEKTSEVKAEIEGGQRGQSAWEFIAGKKDAKITETPVMENVANFKANVEETEQIKTNINSEIELWKKDQIKINELNTKIEQTKFTPTTSGGNIQFMGPDEIVGGSGNIDFLNQEAKKEAQKRTEFRQRLLEGRNETEKSIKNSRVEKYLKDAAKLWPKDKPISERTDEWLYSTAAQLMRSDDEQNLMNKKIAQYYEDNQGIFQVMKPEWANTEVEKAEEYKESLTKKQQANLAQQNFLADSIKTFDENIGNYVTILDNIDYSNYETALKKWDEQIAVLGVEVDEDGRAMKEYPQEIIDEYNRLNIERNKVIQSYKVEEANNKKLFEEYTTEVNNRRKAYQSYLNTVSLDTEYNKQGADLVNYINAMNRNGHNIPVALTWVTTSALRLASGLEGAVNAVKELPEDLLFEYYDNDVKKMPTQVKLMFAMDKVQDQARFVGKDKFNKFIDDMNASVQAPTQYEDIENLSDLGAFGMNVIANFVPQYGLMYATGGASIYIMGTSAFGNKYDDIEFTNRQKFGRTNYTLGEKWLASGVAFGSEVISESFTYGVFKAKTSGLSNYSFERVKDSFGKNILETSKRVSKRTVKNVPYMYQESVSEVFAEFGNNAGDKYVLGKDISLGKGLKGAALSGLFMERAMSMPTLYQDVSSIFAGKNYKQKIAENNAKRKEKEKLLANPDLAPKTREKLENDVLKLVAQNETLMAENIENIDMMSNKEKEDLVKLDTEIIELRATEDAINADESLNDDQKETLIDDIRAQETELLDKQDNIIVQYETEEQRIEKLERFKKQLAQIQKKVNKFNKRKIKDFRATNTGARGRVKVFKTREEQQAFFNEQISEENALLQAQIDAWNEILKDPTKLNEADKEAIGLEDGDALLDVHVNQIKSFIKNLETEIQNNDYNSQMNSKGYGAFRADKYGGFDVFINKENSLRKGGRINTAAHELLHAVLFQSIQEDPETQKALGDAVIEFIGKNKGGFNRKFIRRMEPYQGDSEFGEEIITIMSESIMDGTLDYKENMFTKFGDIIRQHLQRLGLRDITFDSGKDVYNFIKDYNASIEKNYDSIAIEQMMDKGAKGKLLRKNKARPTGKKMESKAESAKSVLNNYAKDEDGNFDKSEYNPNSDIIAAELPGMIAAQVNNYFAKRPSLKITKDGREELEQDILFRLYATTKEGKNDLNRFDGRGDLYGYLNGRIKYRMLDSFEFNPTIMPDFTKEQLEEGRAQLEEETTTQGTPKKQLPTRQLIALETFGETELHNEIKNDLLELGVDGINKYLDVKKAITAHRKFTKDGTEITPEYKAKQKKLEKAAIEKYKKQGFTEKEAKAQAKKDHGVVELKSKRIPTGKYYSILEKVAAKYGITDPIRLITEKDLDTKQRKSAQDYILSKRDEHIVSIPEGTTRAGDPTGIANTIIGKEFFKAGGRMKFKTTGTGKGLKNQAKQRIEPAAYLEIFGLIPKARVNKPSVDPAIRSQIIQTTVIAINQAIRQQQDALKLSQERVDKIKDGKGKLMFAKNEYNLSEVTEDNFKDLYVHPLGTLSSIHDVELSIKKTFYRINSKGKKVPYRSRDLDAMFNEAETYRDAGTRVLNTFLESHPQFRNLIKITMTGGLEGGFFQSVGNFNNLINKTDVKQEYLARKKYSGNGALYNKKYHESINKKEFKEQNDARLPQLYNFFKAVEAHLQNYPEDVWMFEEMLLDTGKQQNVLTRILAPFSFYAVDGDGNPIFDQKIKEEHTDPQNLIGKALLAGAVFNNVDKVWKVVGKSYMQGAILDSDINPHDKMIDDAGLSNEMPQVYYDRIVPRLLSGELKLPNGYSSIVRLAEAGIDLNMYKLAAEGVTIAEYFGVEGMEVSRANRLVVAQLTGDATLQFAKAMNKANLKTQIAEHSRLKEAINKNRMMMSKPSQGITVLDFDDTLATTESLVKFTRPDGTTGTLNAEEYASTYEDLLDQGYTFDFSDFNKVVKGKLAPLFNKAMKLQSKFGPENMFVLTARPPAAQKAIFDFLKANGLNIPLKNITGLGNSTAEAKALWMADKVGEGYNDFYFADDALQNVQAVKNMLDQFDVKSKIQQAKVKFSKPENLNKSFNDILENVTGIESKKRFSAIKARKRGESKGKFRFFIPPSHEDFVGLLYNFIGKGKEGNKHRDFFEKALIRPLNRAFRELNTAKQSIANDYKSLNKQFKDVKKKLTKKTPDGDFTYQDAIRVYLWNKHGYEIPGLSETDQQSLVNLVRSDSELQSYAETLNIISKQDVYVNPTESWEAGDIRTDLDDATGRVGREQFFTEFFENADIIFSQENLNKIEAAYGAGVVSAIKDMLYRIKTGRNRPSGQNKMVNQFLNYLNGSVASTMFFNIRSAVLQQMSLVNFINFADNNIYAAAKAFANQPQYWKDWATIFNSDFMKQRRGGIMTDVNGAELAASVKGAKNPIQAAIKKLLQLGFLPTQIGDNIAIATGGATFLRNRINTYLKQGLSQKEAEAKAFVDFEILAEATQQSARPDMVSQQQASPLGKVILAFQNVTSQFNRLGKKAFLDIKNRRITPGNQTQLQSDMSNLSRIAYYLMIQNLIFYSLQSALFMMMFDDDEEDEKFLKKKERMINGSIDSVLRGSGVWGAVIATLKNMAIKWHEQRDKGWNKDESAVLMEMLNVSPPLGIKARKLVNAEKTLNYNKNVIEEMSTFDLDNPMWSAVTNYVEATTNVPLNRLYNKTQNVRESLDNQHSAFERALMFGGWSKWNLGIGDSEKIKEVKETIKKKKKKAKFGERTEEKIKEGEKKQEQEKKEGKKVTCLVCKLPVVKGKKYCTIHEKKEQRKDGKKKQCRKYKKDGTRCKMQTANKSGYCYYHD